jgi:hypothetical protein
MKTRWFVGTGIVAAALVISLLLWKRDKSEEVTPQVLADRIVSGKPIEFSGGGTMKPVSPSADYFALPAGPQRIAFLDKMIDMQEQMKAKIASGEIQLPPGVEAKRVAPDAKGDESEKQVTSVKRDVSPDGSKESVTIRLNADDLSPSFRAQMQEFAGAMRNRRKERGLDPDAPMMIIRNEVRTSPK